MSRTLKGTLGKLSRQQFGALQRLANEARDVSLAELLNEALKRDVRDQVGTGLPDRMVIEGIS